MLKVFVSYAREDGEAALEIYNWLASIGVEPWIDQRCLLPGQNWEAEIAKAFSDANVILLLLSPRSVHKRGFVQREANEALQKLVYKQPTDVYAVPVLLEPCEVPSQISSRLQYVDWNSPDARSSVTSALALAAEQQSIKGEEGAEFGPFRVIPKAIVERWEGLPGHDISVSYPKFTSQVASPLAEELSQFFEGRARKAAVDARQKIWDQSPDLFSDQLDAPPSNGRWDDYEIAYSSERLLSLIFRVGWYGAGAAHPNSHFETYNFVLTPHLVQLELSDLFSELSPAIEAVSNFSIAELQREYWRRFGREADGSSLEWIKDGAGADIENFLNFSISDDGLTFMFPPYQVGPYAEGSWTVFVPFYDILPYLRRSGPFAWIRPPAQD
ncbi:TIR domain-containing protein [Xanthomonas sp. AM6]|uniref:TIR domain-containing protein n=1 Tax=Xanthomonas sp. AM6 TaxID=2982531 RepID=UPI0021DA99F8|nr:TIR domain-containing protein [Xanthomonas sp. AM6]UYB51171.1 TIR domain-containing protein [Xanthomonas sp. AM6]